jgi:hypothetical protein
VLVTATTETTWTCSRTSPQEQEIGRHRETTTSATTVERVRRQVTGFFVGEILSTVGEGHALHSCPGGAGAGWTFDEDSVQTGETVHSFTLAD